MDQYTRMRRIYLPLSNLSLKKREKKTLQDFLNMVMYLLFLRRNMFEYFFLHKS